MFTIITGPAACGKTRHAKHFQAHYNCGMALDDVDAALHFKYKQFPPAAHLLVLTTASIEAIQNWRWLTGKHYQIIRYEDAYAEIAAPVAGPWECVPSEDTRYLTEIGFRHLDMSLGTIALVGDDEAEIDDLGLARQNANGRVIAAAPCMLRELRVAEEFIAGFEGDELQPGVADILSGIRDVIARAEGRS